MKTNFTIIALLFFCIQVLQAQNENDPIKEIKDEFSLINKKLKDYKLVEKEANEESTEGGSMKGYYENEQLRLLHCEFFGEMGKITEDYYYKDNQLFFVYTIKTDYSAPIYVEESTEIATEENRYYIDNEKLIRWLGKDKKEVKNGSEAFKMAELNIKTESNRVLNLFKN